VWYSLFALFLLRFAMLSFALWSSFFCVEMLCLLRRNALSFASRCSVVQHRGALSSSITELFFCVMALYLSRRVVVLSLCALSFVWRRSVYCIITLRRDTLFSIAALSLSELQGSLSLHTVFCVAALCLLASQRLSVALWCSVFYHHKAVF